MDSKLFITGIAIGMISGAVLVCNSKKLCKMVKYGESCVKEKAEELLKDASEYADSAEKQKKTK